MGLVINFGLGPVTYDVTFIYAALTSAYPTGLNFNNQVDATNAANVLADTLMVLGVTGLTGAGTYNSNNGGLFAMVPFAHLSGSLCTSQGAPSPCFEGQAAQLTTPTFWQSTGPWFGSSTFGPLVSTDFAVFTVEPVPGPTAGAGLPGLVLACGCLLVLVRRRQMS